MFLLSAPRNVHYSLRAFSWGQPHPPPGAGLPGGGFSNSDYAKGRRAVVLHLNTDGLTPTQIVAKVNSAGQYTVTRGGVRSIIARAGINGTLTCTRIQPSRIPLLTKKRAREDVTIHRLTPTAAAKKHIWQQDNASPHVSIATQRFLQNYADKNPNFTYWKKWEWPSKSPDMSGIENVWPMLQRAVIRPDEPGVKSEAEARRRINEFFAAYTVADCRKLLRSMFTTRIEKCIAAEYDIIK